MLALCLRLGRKLCFAVFRGFYPTTVGGDLGGIGGLSMGGGLHINGLSPTSVIQFENSGDVGAVLSVIRWYPFLLVVLSLRHLYV